MRKGCSYTDMTIHSLAGYIVFFTHLQFVLVIDDGVVSMRQEVLLKRAV